MPDCTEVTVDEDDEEEPDTVSFQVQLSNPLPEGVKLSKKANLYINIEPSHTMED